MSSGGGEEPAETEPVLFWQLSLRDGNEARESGLRGEQVIEAEIPAVVGDVVADGHQVAVGVVQEVMVHLRELPAPSSKRSELFEPAGGPRRREAHRVKPGLRDALHGEPRRELTGERGGLCQARRPIEVGGALGPLCFRLEQPGRNPLQVLPCGPDLVLERLRPPGHLPVLLLCHRGEAPLPTRSELLESVSGRRQRPGPELGLQLEAGQVVAQAGRPSLDQHPERVGKPGEHLRAKDRLVRELLEPSGEREQVPSEVSAVDGGYIHRRKGLEGLGVIPVVEVSPVARERFERVERARGALDERRHRDMTEVVGGERRGQGHADVRGRGAVGDALRWILLEVVRRQIPIGGADEHLEEAPGAPRDLAEEGDVESPELVRSRRERLARPPGEERREKPRQPNRRGRGKRARVEPRHRDRGADGADRGARHGPMHLTQIALGHPLRIGRRAPFEEFSLGDEARAGPSDGHGGELSGVGQARKGEHLPAQLRPEGGCDFADVPMSRDLLGPPGQAGSDEARNDEDRHDQRGDRRGETRRRPAPEQQREQRDRNQTAAKVVEDLPLGQPGERVFDLAPVPARNPAAQPGRELPVPPKPANAPRHVGGVGRRLILEEQHVAEQSCPRQRAFEEVVAEHPVLREPAGGRRAEGIDVIDALADVRALVEGILVDVGDGAGIGIDPGLPAVKAGKARATEALQRGRHPRLQDPVSLRHPPLRRVEVGTVERMAHGRSELARRVARQVGIAIERDDIPDAEKEWVVADHRVKPGVIPTERVVQLLDFSALSLPAHPHPLPVVVSTRPVEKVKGRPPRVARVEISDAVAGPVKELLIPLDRLVARVPKVGDQRETELRIGVCELVHLERLEQRVHLRGVGEHGWHRDQRPMLAGDGLREVEPREPARW